MSAVGYAQWNPTTTYVLNDVVEFGGLIYQALIVNYNTPPYPPSPSWQLIGAGGGGIVQTIGLIGDQISLSPSGGTVTVGSATSVALSTQKLTAVTYNTAGLLETNVSGALNVGLGSAIGSASIEGGNVALTSDLAKVEFENGLGILKGSIGYNVGTDFMDLTGSTGLEINTTSGPINIQANGDKIYMITNGNNIELAANTSGGIFADVIISSSDGLIELGTGGNVQFSGTEVITKSVAVIETATPTLRFQTTGVGPTQADVVYNATGSVFSEPSLISDAHEIGISTGPTAGVSIGYNTAISTSYVSGKGDPLFIGENGANSYAGLFLGNGNVGVTDFLILDRKDNTDVTQSAATLAMTGAGTINMESSLATGGIGISTLAAANITIASGQGVGVTATTDIIMTATNDVNITSGFTDINLTASLGQIYQLGGQRVRTKFQSSAFYNPTVSDYAICMENAGGSAVTLPLIDANNVGKQYLILHNSTAGAVSVQTALGSGQTIFSSTGAASANPRSLPIGHCHTFTALQVSAFPSIAYGWAMI
jgi:hypothetical protein